jgi:pSer/pThr/pTyr-binding forkhead associated (FHA) protein
MAKFHILNGNKIGQSITLPDGPSTIGRGDQNTFAIPDDSISTQHVLLMSDAKTCRVKDRDSSNGTFVNGKQVTQADLKNGDIL